MIAILWFPFWSIPHFTNIYELDAKYFVNVGNNSLLRREPMPGHCFWTTDWCINTDSLLLRPPLRHNSLLLLTSTARETEAQRQPGICSQLREVICSSSHSQALAKPGLKLAISRLPAFLIISSDSVTPPWKPPHVLLVWWLTALWPYMWFKDNIPLPSNMGPVIWPHSLKYRNTRLSTLTQSMTQLVQVSE